MPDNIIELPQVDITYDTCLPAKKIMLIGGGRPPQSDWLQKSAFSYELWAVDHGLDACMDSTLIPTQLIGDADSADKNNWQRAKRSGICIEEYSPLKNLTDTQLALQKAAALPQEVFLLMTGFFGGRLDHAFSTLFSCANLGLKGCLADEKEVLCWLTDAEHLRLQTKKKPKAISLLPLSSICLGVDIKNVYWPLTNAELKQELPFAISNELAPGKDHFSVSLTSGLLGVYIYWE